ncbi:MAG: hypothetical protein ACF8NJ_10300 [Phycisphaerales bacterium JB038]
MDSLWGSRKVALDLMEGPLAEERDAISELFDILERLVHLLERAPGGDLPRLSALILAKAHRLSVGTYSLLLDALGQEAGALYRVIQECFELIEYVRMDPSHLDRTITRGPPSAGNIAKRIGGNLKDVRDHLNSNASHFSLTDSAILHLIDAEAGRLRLERRPSEQVLGTNLRLLAAYMFRCCQEGVEVLLTVDEEAGAGLYNDLLAVGEEVHLRHLEEGESEPR